jgi:hypothetical protein
VLEREIYFMRKQITPGIWELVTQLQCKLKAKIMKANILRGGRF